MNGFESTISDFVSALLSLINEFLNSLFESLAAFFNGFTIS